MCPIGICMYVHDQMKNIYTGNQHSLMQLAKSNICRKVHSIQATSNKLEQRYVEQQRQRKCNTSDLRKGYLEAI